MSDSEPIIDIRPALAVRSSHSQASAAAPATGLAPISPTRDVAPVTAFNRQELADILRVYGRFVATGEWRDYAIDMGREAAVFSIFRRSSECPIYRIEKSPKLARRQGAYSIVAASGQILKRGHDLQRVLTVFDKALRLVGR